MKLRSVDVVRWLRFHWRIFTIYTSLVVCDPSPGLARIASISVELNDVASRLRQRGNTPELAMPEKWAARLDGSVSQLREALEWFSRIP
jgi:hypothetical protein